MNHFGKKYLNGKRNNYALILQWAFVLVTIAIGIKFSDKLNIAQNPFNNILTAEAANPFDIQNVMVAKPTTDSVTVLITTTINSDITIHYGATASYGYSVTSTNQTTHKILISNLDPGTFYHYQLTATQTDDPLTTLTKSDTTFYTQPVSGTSFSFATISDMQGSSWTNVASQIQTLDPDLLLSVGDNIAGENTTDSATYLARWQQDVFSFTQDLTNHIASYWTMGNHDFVGYNRSAGFTEFAKVLSLPIPPENTENYYSFDYGDVHFAVVDATQSTVSANCLTWLDNDLSSTSKKWRIVLMHLPGLAPSGVSNLDQTSAQALHNTFINRGVQLVINGHSHIYNRWVKDGIFYVTNPPAGYSAWPSFSNSTGDAGTIGASISTKGYTVGSVTPSQLTISAYNDSGVLRDTFSISPDNFDIYSPENYSCTTDNLPTFSWNPANQTDEFGVPPLDLMKYQLYIDGVLNRDSISALDTSTTPTSELGVGAHTWYVVAINNANKSQRSTSEYYICIYPTLDHININPSDSQNITVGQSIQFTAQGQDENNNDISDLTYSWSGADSDGLFTATIPGTFYIKASSGGIDSLTTIVNVSEENIPNIPPVFTNLPGVSSQINLENNQIITTNPYIIMVKPTDSDGISRVEFYIDDILIGTTINPDGNGVYSCSWDTSMYHSDVEVVAYDIYGNPSTILSRTTQVILASYTSGNQQESSFPGVLPKAGPGDTFFIVALLSLFICILLFGHKKKATISKY